MTSAPHTLAALRAGQLAGITRLDLACDLHEFPREIFDLADSLEVLNLSGNQLSSLPDDLSRLGKLRVIFCSENRFTHVPEVLSTCPHLNMVGFKSNQIRAVPASALAPWLRWLILTDNQISELPDVLGNCASLQKLMLAGNHLTRLPEAMAGCVGLELLRLSANRFEALPEWVFRLPRLAWLAIAGNPMAAPSAAESALMAQLSWADIELGEKLGEGASGVIHKAHWQPAPETAPRLVAVKLFKGAVTSDGFPADELAACLAVGQHPNLIRVLGQIRGHPAGRAGLVMAWVDEGFRTLAGPPSLATCTRDVYPDGRRFSLPVALRLAHGLANAAQHLHERGIMHGDFYAHNVLYNTEGECFLGDFGGASFYPKTRAGYSRERLFEALDVRAFGCLLGELIERCSTEIDPSLNMLKALQLRCVSPVAGQRPLFAEIGSVLRTLSR
jgi:Protein tyrosine and serine/threonine kinase/Leucine rich repeat